MPYSHWMKVNDNDHLIRLYFEERPHDGEAWKLCLSCSAEFEVGEGESCVSPTSVCMSYTGNLLIGCHPAQRSCLPTSKFTMGLNII